MTDQASTAAPPDGGSLRRIAILLVDDQKFVGMAVGRLLSTEPDFDLHCCLTAIDAIPRAQDIRPAIILQDLVMPDIDGLTMVRRFRENPSTLHTPIVVLSGDDAPEAAARARSAGANDYLVKLPSKENLVACIRRHVADAPAV
jgi:PleD family two-component response regulator